MTPIDPDDPRLTAHVLAELPPAEAAVIEMACWREGTVRAEVERLRELAEELTFAFAAEKKPSLTPAQQRVALKTPPVPAAFPEAEIRLTACALGELPPEEMAVLAAKAEHDRAAALEMELTGMLSSILRQNFAQERPLTLTDAQRENVRSVPVTAPAEPAFTVVSPPSRQLPARPGPRPAFSWPRVLKAAAVIVAAAGLGYLMAPETRQALAVWLHLTPSDAPTPVLRAPKTELTVERLLALIESELNRPASTTALDAREAPPETAPPAPTPAPPPELNEKASAARLAASIPQEPPRPQPDASVLPPAHAGIAQETPTMAAQKSADMSRMLLATRPRRSTSTSEFYRTSRAAAAHLPATLGRASYDVVRQFWRDFALPPPANLVRPEEIINQFDYDAHPAPGQDFGVAIEAAMCPWNEQHQLVRVTVAARETADSLQPLRLTFALRIADTADSERTQLLFWQGLQALLPRLRSEDSVAITVWGKSHGLVLAPTSGWRHETIRDAAARWERGGTVWAGGDWGTLVAAMRSHHDPQALNRCVIITDGPLDFTGNPAFPHALPTVDLPGASLTLAHLGPRRGPTGVIAPAWQADSSAEAARLLCREALTPLTPVAEHVDIEVQFSAKHITSWRPIGFSRNGSENLAAPGSRSELPWLGGQQVTALYEVIPVAHANAKSVLDARKNGDDVAPLNVRVRWTPTGTKSTREMNAAWASSAGDWRTASPDFRFAAGAAAYALQLTGDQAALALPFSRIRELTATSPASDPFGLRAEFTELINLVPASR